MNKKYRRSMKVCYLHYLKRIPNYKTLVKIQKIIKHYYNYYIILIIVNNRQYLSTKNILIMKYYKKFLMINPYHLSHRIIPNINYPIH